VTLAFDKREIGLSELCQQKTGVLVFSVSKGTHGTIEKQ
jgi:BioD-like phosphotransacetylase family protein